MWIPDWLVTFFIILFILGIIGETIHAILGD